MVVPIVLVACSSEDRANDRSAPTIESVSELRTLMEDGGLVCEEWRQLPSEGDANWSPQPAEYGYCRVGDSELEVWRWESTGEASEYLSQYPDLICALFEEGYTASRFDGQNWVVHLPMELDRLTEERLVRAFGADPQRVTCRER